MTTTTQNFVASREKEGRSRSTPYKYSGSRDMNFLARQRGNLTAIYFLREAFGPPPNRKVQCNM